MRKGGRYIVKDGGKPELVKPSQPAPDAPKPKPQPDKEVTTDAVS